MIKLQNFNALSLIMFLGSCGAVDYDSAPEGQFTGSLFVMWVEEGGQFGDGTFVYVPNPSDPLTFVRGGETEYTTIRPEMMYTDGGSIPKAAQLFEGFSPWGYAPAYMVHDWLFVARHCNLDDMPTKREEALAGMEFQDSAEIIAEAIKTLVQQDRIRENDVAPRIISSTVAGPISRAIWNTDGSCLASRVSEADRLAAEAGIPGSSQPQILLDRELPNGDRVPVRPGRPVAQIDFQ